MAKDVKGSSSRTSTVAPTAEAEVVLLEKVKDFFNDNRFRKVIGLLFIWFCISCLVAFSSYFITWKSDQDEVFLFSWRLLLTGNVLIENTLGRLGAILSHQFMFNGFGVAAFVIPYLAAVIGLNLLFSGTYKKIIYNLAVGVPLMIFCATAASVFFGHLEFAVGGGIGNVISQWLLEFVGFTGTMLVLGFAIVVSLVMMYNLNLLQVVSWFKRKEKMVNTIINPDAIAKSEMQLTPTSMTNEEDELMPYISNTVPVPKPVVEVAHSFEPFIDIQNPTFENNNDAPVASAKGATTPKYHALEIENTTADDDLFLQLPPPPAPPDNYLNITVTTPNSPPPLAPTDNNPAMEHVFTEDEFTPFDPTLELSSYKFPSVDLMTDYKTERGAIDKDELQRNSDQIIQTLNNYNIAIDKIKATVGPTVTLYEIVPAAGVRISKIKNLEDDIALSLSALGIRIIAPMPGKGTIGIEVPNVNKEVVSMRSVIMSPAFANSTAELPIGMGKTINNEIFVFDLAKMPHLLMAGATGQGKSVGLNAVLASLLYKKHPSQLKLVLIDPKKVELSLYKLIEKHFLAKLPGEADPIITDTKKVIATLQSLCIEMDERYDLLKTAQVRNIIEYNKKFIERRLNPNKGHRFMPYIVLVIDEFADLIMTAGKEIEMPIARLAQLARAIGIHLIVATQRPSVNIITGTIKANFPGRIAFKVSSKIDSRTIMDAGGAEQLIGKGDMLINNSGDLIRVQCAYLDLPEVERLTEFIGSQRGYSDAYLLPEFFDESNEGNAKDFDMSDRDPLFADAARVIVASQQGSTSMIQRRLKLGYNRAGRLMDQLEGAGIVGQNEGSKAREVLVKSMEELEHFLTNIV